jgi:hypothetical protein
MTMARHGELDRDKKSDGNNESSDVRIHGPMSSCILDGGYNRLGFHSAKETLPRTCITRCFMLSAGWVARAGSSTSFGNVHDLISHALCKFYVVPVEAKAALISLRLLL